jgi:hypothetical protein
MHRSNEPEPSRHLLQIEPCAPGVLRSREARAAARPLGARVGLEWDHSSVRNPYAEVLAPYQTQKWAYRSAR